jgi:VIT1/CCC1 family predicted Fe2+/Mn2+ transporter
VLHARHHRAAERHRTSRTGWLRASVLGANDGILSTGALLIGVAGAGAGRGAVLVAGVAAVAAGATSMGIGEYVSVSTQADVERSDRRLEAAELAADPVAETAELRSIYVQRGLPEPLAQQVAEAFMAADPLGSHLRDELGHSEDLAARPVQAALSSTASFAAGALLPLGAAAAAVPSVRVAAIAAATLAALVVLGAVGAALGGAERWRGALRVGVGGAVALAITFAVGSLLGTAVG